MRVHADRLSIRQILVPQRIAALQRNMPEQDGEEFFFRYLFSILRVEDPNQIPLRDHTVEVGRRHGVGVDQIRPLFPGAEAFSRKFPIDRAHFLRNSI